MNIALMKMIDNILSHVSARWLDGLLLSNAGIITVLGFLEKFQGAISFAIVLGVTIAIRALKARQEMRHSEEIHKLEMKRRLQDIEQDEQEFRSKYPKSK